jgi:hypothetical protein
MLLSKKVRCRRAKSDDFAKSLPARTSEARVSQNFRYKRPFISWQHRLA